MSLPVPALVGAVVAAPAPSAVAPTVAAAPALLGKADIDTVTRAAVTFTRIYYGAYDSPYRVRDLPNFYRPSSSLTWNGNSKTGVDGLNELIANMPPTKHEMHSFDCHPIPGTSPPNLLLTVSGSVVHGKGPAGNPPGTGSRTIDGHPRVFSQTFILMPDPSAKKTGKAGEVAKYFVSADALRFVG